jgi:N-acetylglutamate synthase-like GNAT family acetyltransferase
MMTRIHEIHDGDVVVSTDKARIDVPLVFDFLHNRAYWSKGVPRERVERAIEHSMCFGVYREAEQLGFARVITDLTGFAYIADVFIVEAARGRGIGKKLMRAILAHPELQGIRRFMLATHDAHDLYKQLGFTPLAHPEHMMEQLAQAPAPPEGTAADDGSGALPR